MPEHRLLVELDGLEKAYPQLEPADLAEKLAEESDRVVNAAMVTIKTLADKVEKTMKTMIEKPEKLELAFGLKLELENGALVARSDSSASLNLKLTWVTNL